MGVGAYADHPNVWKIDDAYRTWRSSHPKDKTTFTQFYKKWRRAMEPYIDAAGWVKIPEPA